MTRLVTTSQAAQILGLSLQGVHYRIKKNQLRSIKKSGKTFVYITDNNHVKASSEAKVEPVLNNKKQDNIDSIIEVKNDQIKHLKKSIKWMKKQYTSEIVRLEDNQKRIIEVFNSEIKLLQSAFNEMRSIYKQPMITENNFDSQDIEFMSLKDFLVIMKKYNKTHMEIKDLIFKAIKNNDERFIYNKKEKKILIVKSDFKDFANF